VGNRGLQKGGERPYRIDVVWELMKGMTGKRPISLDLCAGRLGEELTLTKKIPKNGGRGGRGGSTFSLKPVVAGGLGLEGGGDRVYIEAHIFASGDGQNENRESCIRSYMRGGLL